ncbi:glycosyltransferase [Patescibacteria group bacterium]|nr:glycosyltransferase [Patescibacteria group bacterium]
MAVIHDRAAAANPKISVISFCLNSARYLRETIESVLKQTYTNYELVVKDGGSTDGTIDILKEYPMIRWVSEKEGGDNPILDAIWQAFYLSRGDYIIYLAVSDGISDSNWFSRAAAILDKDPEISWVWGINQAKSEDGHLGKIAWPEYLQNPPPQKMAWFPFWLATGQGQETNACFRRTVFEHLFPKNNPAEPYRFFPTLGFNYRLNSMGYMPYFLPIISFYGYTHSNQRQEKLYQLLDSVSKRYDHDRTVYRRNFLSGRITHRFRDGSFGIVKEVTREELWRYRRKIWEYRLKMKIRRELQKLLDHVRL